jgi:hypothetical protein
MRAIANSRSGKVDHDLRIIVPMRYGTCESEGPELSGNHGADGLDRPEMIRIYAAADPESPESVKAAKKGARPGKKRAR